MTEFEKITAQTKSIGSNHVPSQKLCRFFQRQEYLDCFLSQRYRFGNLSNYTNSSSDARSDASEGQAEFQTQDGTSHGSFSSGYYYIISFSEENQHLQKDTLAKKFGVSGNDAICYSIDDNIALTKNIISKWKQSPQKNDIAFFSWYKVLYTKNSILAENCFEEKPFLHVYQKPECAIKGIYKLKRINKTPLPQPLPGQPKTIDIGGDIGDIHEFNTQNWLDMLNYKSLKLDPDFKKIDSDVKINNYSIEQEYRLVLFTDRINKESICFY